jgi:hypothetical protein
MTAILFNEDRPQSLSSYAKVESRKFHYSAIVTFHTLPYTVGYFPGYPLESRLAESRPDCW